MKILFLSQGNHDDITLWSGTVYNLSSMLESLGHKVKYIDNIRVNPYISRVLKIRDIITKKNYKLDRSKFILKNHANKIHKELKQNEYDLIFSPSTLPIAYLKTRIPIVTFTDATFNNMVNYYDGFCNLSKSSLRDGNYHEKMALEKCSMAIYSSEWASQSSIKDYNIEESKVKVINFGANVKNEYKINDIELMIEEKINTTLELLFIGVDWDRKGGVTVLKTLEKIKSNNIDVKLNIVGCIPEIPSNLKEDINIYGFLNKSKKEDLSIITKLFEQSHFLFVPTQKEAFGIVYAEASSYGLPSIATNTGGVSSAIRDGYNGYCLPIDSDEEDYSKLILDIFKDKDRYKTLCRTSYNEYITRLNWNTVGGCIESVLNQVTKITR